MAIATVDQVKEALGKTSTADDALIQRLLDSVSLQVERRTAKRFEPNPPFDTEGDDTNPEVTVEVPVTYFPGMIVPPYSVPPSPWQLPNPSPPFRASLANPVFVRIPHARELSEVAADNQTPGSSSFTALTADQYLLQVDPTLYAGPPAAPIWRKVQLQDLTMLPPSKLQLTGRFGIVPAPDDLVDVVIAMTARRYKERDAQWGDAVQLGDGAVTTYFRQFPASVQATIDSYCELGV